MKRRAFLVTLAGAALGSTGLVLVFRNRTEPVSRLGDLVCEGGRTLSVDLDDLLERPGSVRSLGRVILSSARIRPGRSELAERLFAGDAWARACRDGARPVLREAIRRDFREDRTVDVRGWILSRTEADLYALAELVLSSA